VSGGDCINSLRPFIGHQTVYKGDLWNPQSQNLYAYVANNPLKYVDPSGNTMEGDENLSQEIQDEIKWITKLWTPNTTSKR
jgi:hypothetical protein